MKVSLSSFLKTSFAFLRISKVVRKAVKNKWLPCISTLIPNWASLVEICSKFSGFSWMYSIQIGSECHKVASMVDGVGIGVIYGARLLFDWFWLLDFYPYIKAWVIRACASTPMVTNHTIFSIYFTTTKKFFAKSMMSSFEKKRGLSTFLTIMLSKSDLKWVAQFTLFSSFSPVITQVWSNSYFSIMWFLH